MKDSSQSIPRIHIVGRRNSGKTTLVCELVRELTDRGIRVATIKHTHHNHELDTPGKDSWKHRESGAVGVGILSPYMTAVFVPSERTQDTQQDYEWLSGMFKDVELVIVEGDLNAQGVKLEVWRTEVSEPPYSAGNRTIHAVVTDDEVDCNLKVWLRSDVASLATQILEITNDRR